MKIEELEEEDHHYLCDVCGYKWEVVVHPDYSHRTISLDDETLHPKEPTKCPSCGTPYLSEI
ncbi:MAG: hypothetical protein QME07_07920 [bacterium]|nr:hypothetical protein [bacterium]